MTAIALPLISEPAPTTPLDDEAGLGCLSTSRGNLPLSTVDIDGQVTGLLHATRLRQTFVNVHDEPLEATYVFPLPDRAAVTAFRMEVADRVIDGVVKERDEARQEYDTAIAAGQRAAIAEEERPNVFTVRVGNLMPGDVATVELTLTGPLAVDLGEATWRFPLVVAPRYIPGTALPGAQVGDGTALDTDAVPDASRITPPVLLPGFPHPVRLTAKLSWADGEAPAGITSAVPAELSGATVTIRPGQRLDRDLIIRFAVGGEAVQTALTAHDGTFALTLVPPSIDQATATPRDVVFVLDRSGSMDGWKMIAARRAVARMVDSLGSRDRFAVMAFDNNIEYPPGQDAGCLTEATDRQRFRAVEFLATLGAYGGTEMLQPLLTGATMLAGTDEPGGAGRRRIMVLVTDGQVGNEDQILRAVAEKSAGMRIFTVGIDTAVNDAFLRRLAAIGAGSSEFVESEDRLDAVMERIHRRIGDPVLTDITIESVRLDEPGYDAEPLDIDIDTLAPAKIPALHAGAPVLILGRHRGAGTGSLVVNATDINGDAWVAFVSVKPGGTEALTPAWARARIRDLEDRYATTHFNTAAIEKEIIATSIAGQVLSRFTAFIAIDARVVNEGGKLRKITQPVEAPAGWDMFGASDEAMDSPKMSKRSSYVGGGLVGGVAGAGPGSAPMPPPMAMPPMSAAPMSAPPMPSAPMPMSPHLDAAAAPAPASKPSFARARRSGARPANQPYAGSGAAETVPRKESFDLDLTPYRERAADLADRFTRGQIDASALRRELTDLVDDLRSIGADAVLVDALAELRTAIGDGWSGDVAALRDFATPATAAPVARKPFWKRS